MTRLDPGGNLPPTRDSKYQRPRRLFSWVGLMAGLLLGIAGGLFYAWMADPRVEFDTEPWQLNKQDRARYVAGITLSYAYDGDLNRAVERLLAMRSSRDPIQDVADTACELATSGYVDSSSGLRAIRSMMLFYQLQGRAGCADMLVPVSVESTPIIQIDLPTPTPPPPATKTPTPESSVLATPTPLPVVVPTVQPERDFDLVAVRTYCDTALSGLIEVRVQDFNGDGIPGQRVRVKWDDGESTFLTGLKPERGPDYADFQMEASKGYTVEMPGRSDPSAQPLVAAPCTANNGQPAITSYQVYFRPTG